MLTFIFVGIIFALLIAGAIWALTAQSKNRKGKKEFIATTTNSRTTGRAPGLD